MKTEQLSMILQAFHKIKLMITVLSMLMIGPKMMWEYPQELLMLCYLLMTSLKTVNSHKYLALHLVKEMYLSVYLEIDILMSWLIQVSQSKKGEGMKKG